MRRRKGEPHMKEFKSIQELIIKAALYDGISTIISPDELIGRGDVLKITFSRDNRYSSTHIGIDDRYRDPEEVSLHCCKRALYDLLQEPYEEITYPKEDNNGSNS
jgi:hypothetical protein